MYGREGITVPLDGIVDVRRDKDELPHAARVQGHLESQIETASPL
jgi:hypothetical protein